MSVTSQSRSTASTHHTRPATIKWLAALLGLLTVGALQRGIAMLVDPLEPLGMPVSYRWIQLKLEWLQYAFTDLLTAAPKPPVLADAAQAAHPRPVLLIAGGGIPDEINAAEFIAREAGSHVSTWVVPGAGHTQGLSTAPESWEREVVAFLDTAMGG